MPDHDDAAASALQMLAINLTFTAIDSNAWVEFKGIAPRWVFEALYPVDVPGTIGLAATLDELPRVATVNRFQSPPAEGERDGRPDQEQATLPELLRHLMRLAAYEIERLRAENEEFRSQLADAEDVARALDKYGFPPPGWEEVNP